jgi:hypothetical protein
MTGLLVVMGSGETTPTMVSTHQRVFAALGESPTGALIDTPYGFQENADELTARTRDYFGHNVGRAVEVASLRRAEAMTPVRLADVVATVRNADWVFAGPGSPTYLAAQWRATELPSVLRDRLAPPRGATVFASAAACTLGAATIPVYEIYKAGEDPHWRDGLDLLTAIGLDAVVVPHFDNAEGGTHDTRYCYLGERRLRIMEELLPSTTWVLGVDEHTALVVDLDRGLVRVEGRGGVTVRARDASARFPAGEEVELASLVDAAVGRPATGGAGTVPAGVTPTHAADAVGADASAATGSAGDLAVVGVSTAGAPTAGTATSPLLEEVAEAAGAFDTAIADDDAMGAAEVTVALEGTIRDWSSDVLQSDELDRSRAELRRQIAALARLAQQAMHAHRDLVAPHVAALLALREQARAERRFADADAIRDALISGGVEVRDRPDGTDWQYHDPLDDARD